MTSVDLKNLSIEDLKKRKHNEVKNLRKEFSEYKENQDKQSLKFKRLKNKKTK